MSAYAKLYVACLDDRALDQHKMKNFYFTCFVTYV